LTPDHCWGYGYGGQIADSPFDRDGDPKLVTDRLTLTRALEGGGMESEAAERIATEIYDAIHNNVATKADLAAVRGEMREMESRIIIRLGALSVVVAGALFGALHAWPPH
jgi:hypothetical protein